MNKIIFHIDANYFFARCEEIIDPKLTLIPFVVSSKHKRSVVSTSNQKARELGIKSADKLSKLIKNQEIYIINLKHHYYQQKSNELFESIKEFLQLEIERASIDECYVDVSQIINEYHNNYEILASQLKQYVFNKTKLIISIGIGNNKFLAKTANEFKSSNNNVNVIFSNEVKTKLWPLQINKIYLIGKKTADLLEKLKIKRVIDFLQYYDQEKLKKILKQKYYVIRNYCNGIDNSIIDTNYKIPKSIGSGETFITNTSNYHQIIKKMDFLFNDIYNRIINKNWLIGNINLNIKFNYHIHKSKSRTLSTYTNNKNILWSEFIYLFHKLWDGEEIRAITLTFSNIIDQKDFKEQLKLTTL